MTDDASRGCQISGAPPALPPAGQYTLQSSVPLAPKMIFKERWLAAGAEHFVELSLDIAGLRQCADVESKRLATKYDSMGTMAVRHDILAPVCLTSEWTDTRPKNWVTEEFGSTIISKPLSVDVRVDS